MKTDRLYLTHILECISNIEEDTAGGRDEFMARRTLRDAVMRNLQILTESSHHVNVELKEQHPEIPWAELWAFRHVAAHDYFRIDYNRIWDIVVTELTPLKTSVEEILRDLAG